MPRLNRYLTTLPVILLAVVVAHLMQPYFDRTNVVMVYMLAVVVVAFRLGTGPAVMGCLLSVLLFDFVNVPPYFSLGTEAYEYVFTLTVMLITAGIISTLAGRLKQKAQESQEREARTASLYALSAELAAQPSDSEILESAIRHISQAFQARTEVFRTEEGTPLPAGPDREAAALARRTGPVLTHHNGDSVQATAPLVVEGVTRFFLCVSAPAQRLGSNEQREHLAAMIAQCAQAMERACLRARVQEKELLIQKESLRNSILNAVSHDLRTPLASIIGASSSLMAEGDSFSVESRQRLRSVIYEEATHMLHMVENLLDMAKLQGGDLRLACEWEALEEIVGSAVAAIRRRVKSHELVVEVPHDLPFVYCDSVLIERVLINLLENAVKYSPPGTPVRLSALCQRDLLVVTVSDRGTGIPVAQRERVFDPFFRLHDGASGGGLGLSICRSIVEVHGGRIWIGSASEGGTAVSFTLPLAGEGGPVVTPPAGEEAELP